MGQMNNITRQSSSQSGQKKRSGKVVDFGENMQFSCRTGKKVDV
jgi:hypothetical protein